MPRSASSAATAAMNGCVMPAPAPCASTRQARACPGASKRPETRRSASTGTLTGLASEPTRRLPIGRPASAPPRAYMTRPQCGAEEGPMCRNIRTLFNFEPPATEAEIRASALQFVRKLSGFTAPSKTNEAAFNQAVDDVTDVARRLLASLATASPPRNRDVEAMKAKARARARYG